MMEAPELSVVIASYNAACSVTACLESLRRQRTRRRFEVILVDSSTDGTADLVAREFPAVRLFSFSNRHFCGDARNIAITEAAAPVVAFIDADCVADESWVERICVGHEGPYLAIGGAIANGRPSTLTGWAAYFSEFSQWMPNTPEQWMVDVAGANMSYKVSAFDQCGRFIGGTYCSDTEFHWRLAENGHQIRFRPDILISHHFDRSWPDFIRHEFFHGRSFATVRVNAQGFSRWRRAVYVMLGLPLAAKIVATIVARNLANRTYLSRCVGTAPLWVAGVLSWSAGECAGYLGGGAG
jgi:GT2 family glycosyltransferase